MEPTSNKESVVDSTSKFRGSVELRRNELVQEGNRMMADALTDYLGMCQQIPQIEKILDSHFQAQIPEGVDITAITPSIMRETARIGVGAAVGQESTWQSRANDYLNSHGTEYVTVNMNPNDTAVEGFQKVFNRETLSDNGVVFAQDGSRFNFLGSNGNLVSHEGQGISVVSPLLDELRGSWLQSRQK